MTSANVAYRLAHWAHREEHRAAVIVPGGGQLTFAQLHTESDALANGLLHILPAGSRVAVMVPPSLEFFRLTFALLKAGLVPVMIDPGMGLTNVGKCLAEADPAAFIGSVKAHAARRLYRWLPDVVTIHAGRRRWFCSHSTYQLGLFGNTLPRPANTEMAVRELTPVAATDTAAILFTSGSTGLAKGVVYTHGIFAAQVAMLKSIYGIEPGEIDLCTFPLFALFGPALGMTCVVPRMNASRPATIDPARTIQTIQHYNITNMFGSPAVIRRIGEYGAKHHVRITTVRRAISAGAPARMDEVARFQTLLNDDVQTNTPYGATEALPVANIGSHELLATRSHTEAGHGICIGRPVPGVTVHIVPIDDGPVPVYRAESCLKTGEIGEFVVRGPIVTASYFRRDDATRLAKMHDPATGETLHRMGDVGYYDDEGRLWFCGRKSHRVQTSSTTLFTDQIEPIFNAINNVYRTALVGVPGHAVICVELIHGCDHHREWPHVLSKLQQRASSFALTRDITTFLRHEGPFPVDPRHNSKINREQLAKWAARAL